MSNPAPDGVPDGIDDICRRAAALQQAGRFDEAVALHRGVLDRDPQHLQTLILLGRLHVQTGQGALAVPLMQRAIGLNPNIPEAHDILGAALCNVGRPQEALASYEALIALAPHARAHINRAVVLSGLSRAEEAVASLDAAIALDPSAVDAHHLRGIQLHRLGRLEASLASLDRAVALGPGVGQAWNSRGITLGALGRLDEAVASFDRAIALIPDHAEAYKNRGVALASALRIDAAIASYTAAIALKPGYAEALWPRGMLLLLQGRFEEGWPDYEWRKRTAALPPRRFDHGQPWLGDADLAGKTLFLYNEQGLGDTIQFARYVKLLAGAGAEIVLCVQDSLKSLLGQLAPGDRIIGEREPHPEYDYHCSLMSLPLALGTTLETIPAGPAYLRADPERLARFEAMLGPRTRPRVGLAWAGSPRHKNDRNRSMAFDTLAPLLTADVEWVCLQNEIRAADAAALDAHGAVAFHGPALADFSDAAALLELMDLVITVDTSIAHLAGAMGKPVWILLPFEPDWRWMLDRADSPWHPSARLFRQARIGDWAGVIDEVAMALRSWGARAAPVVDAAGIEPATPSV